MRSRLVVVVFISSVFVFCFFMGKKAPVFFLFSRFERINDDDDDELMMMI